MHQICRFSVALLLTTSLAGCAVMSAGQVALLVLSLPGPAKSGTVKLSGYSLGPVSSQEVTDLLLEAISPDEGTVHFTGQIEWTGLSRLKQSFGESYQSMSAITDFNILFLWWSEASERYDVLMRLPFAEIYSIELWTPGFGTAIRFCLEKDEIPIGDEILGIDRRTTFRVMKPGVLIDAEKTKEVFKLLDSKVTKKTESQDQPSPCPVPTDESSIGFGYCDPAVEEC